MKFTAGEIISAGTGILACEMDGVYKILNFLTGDSLYTHQLPRAFRACKAHMQKQCPWLSEIDEEKCTRETYPVWRIALEEKHGLEHELSPLPDGVWNRREPLEELVEMTSGKTPIAVVVKGESK